MYAPDYIAWCLIQHCSFALLCASGPLALTWTIWFRGSRDRRTWRSLSLLGFALAATSHWLAGGLALGF